MSQLNIRNRNKNIPNKQPNWEYRFEIAKTNGKRNYISKSGFNTKLEAMEKGAVAYNNYITAGIVEKNNKLSIADYLEWWLNKYVHKKLSYRTAMGYGQKIHLYIIPYLGKYYLKTLDSLSIQNWIDTLCFEKNLSYKYALSILKVFKSALEYAVIPANFIHANPATHVKMPIKNTIKKEKIIRKEEVSKILDYFKNNRVNHLAVLLGYYTGLRVGEIYALTWSDINFENQTLTVNKEVQRIVVDTKQQKYLKENPMTKSRWYFTEPKTQCSYRTIKIGDTLLLELKKFRDFQDYYEKYFGELYFKQYLKPELSLSHKQIYQIVQLDDTAGLKVELERIKPIFVKENGLYSGTEPSKYIGKISREVLKIPFHFHMLRHTHATILIENGAPMKDVQERLGHSNIRTTMDIYVSDTEKMKTASMHIFEKFGKIN